jgi:hypothetical protein
MILAALLVPAPQVCLAQAPPQARVTVEVKSKTANGATVAGDEVSLLLFRGQEQIDSLQATAGQDGKAVFEKVPTGPDISAIARAKHQNMAFTSLPVSLNPAAGELSAAVEVYDVSTDTSKLFVGTHHIIVAVKSASLEVTEYMQLTNPSDMAITGARRDDRNRPIVIEARLPRGFKGLAVSSYLEEEALVVTPEGFYDTMAVPPGEHHVAFSYKLDISRNAMEIAREFTLPTSELMIFWQHGQGKLEGLGEPASRLVKDDGTPVEYYLRSNLKPGDRIAFQVSGFNVKQSDRYTWMILIAVFAAAVAIALLRLRRKPAGSGRRT